MNRSDWIALLFFPLAVAGCNEARANDLAKRVYTPEELEKIGREGPAPQSSSQRFLPDRTVMPPSLDKSPVPSRADWTSAPDATEVRITDPGCTVKRIREWYRVECPRNGFVSLTSGNRDNVTVGGREDGAWIVFPARVGDVRAAEFLHRFKWSLDADVLLSEQWLPGDSAPSITVSGIRD